MPTHANARVSISRGRGDWKAFYNVKDGRATGELWDSTNQKLRDFTAKIESNGTFRINIGVRSTGSGVKVSFKH